MGDFVEVPFNNKKRWLLVIDIVYPIPNDLCKTDEEKFMNIDFLKTYWKQHYNMDIQEPNKILLCVHFDNNGKFWTYPDSVITNVEHNKFAKKLYFNYMDEILEPVKRELRFKYLSRHKNIRRIKYLSRRKNKSDDNEM